MSDARAMLMKLLVHYSGMTQRAVSHRPGLTDGSGVSRSIAERNHVVAQDKRLARPQRGYTIIAWGKALAISVSSLRD